MLEHPVTQIDESSYSFGSFFVLFFLCPLRVSRQATRPAGQPLPRTSASCFCRGAGTSIRSQKSLCRSIVEPVVMMMMTIERKRGAGETTAAELRRSIHVVSDQLSKPGGNGTTWGADDRAKWRHEQSPLCTQPRRDGCPAPQCPPSEPTHARPPRLSRVASW